MPPEMVASIGPFRPLCAGLGMVFGCASTVVISVVWCSAHCAELDAYLWFEINWHREGAIFEGG